MLADLGIRFHSYNTNESRKITVTYAPSTAQTTQVTQNVCAVCKVLGHRAEQNEKTYWDTTPTTNGAYEGEKSRKTPQRKQAG